MIHVDHRDDPHEILRSVLARLSDCSDVLRAIAVASKLLVESLEVAEADVMELARLASDKEETP